MAEQEGATPEPKQDNGGECMNRYKHIWQWVWVGPAGNRVWTDTKRCTTCGAEKSAQRFPGQ